MKVGSLFAGVGGFDRGLELAGHSIVWQVEINDFSNRVLERRWPHTPRGVDVREWTGDGHEHIDLLCGGFPCQDLSIAGKRVGLKGERSGLFWEIVRIAERLRPTFLLLENVPGLLSSNQGKDISTVLDALYELGYIVEIDECDSQYFGLAQRRKRLFICGINAKAGLLGKTHISSAMRCSFLAQSLLDALESLSRQSPTVASDSDCSYYLAEHGLTRKMRCCEASLGKSAWLNWLSDLEGQLPLSAIEPKDSDSPQGVNGSAEEMDIASLLREAEFVGNISKSWKELWGDLSENPKASTISTWSKQTTDLKICICAEISLSILRHIVASKHSSPFCLNAISSALTAVLAATSSVERIAHDLFAPEAWRDRAWLFLEQAAIELDAIERCPTEQCVEEVLFASESSGRNFAASHETGAHVASSLRSRSKNIGQSNGEELNDSTEAHAYEVLQSVRCKVGEKEMERWGLGVVARFRQSEILQSELHGGELRRKASVANVMLGDGSLPFQEDDRAGAMPKMQDQKGAACASQKWKLEGQLTSEFREIVSQLSRSSPQQKGIMRALWRASEGIGVLRTALSEIQEAWRSDLHQDQAATLRSRNSSPGVNPPGRGGEDDMNVVCAPLNHSPYGDQQGDESKLVVAATLKQRMRGCTDEVMDTLQVVQALKNLGSGGPDDNEAQAGHLVTHTLRGEGVDASEDGTGRGTPLVPIAEVGAKTQMGGGRNGCGIGQPGDPMFTLQAGKQHAVGVRRLTPTETERLQGFPDGWTCLCQPLEYYDSNRCTCPDGHRYKAMGNAVSVPVIEWIGKRLKQQERSL